MLTLGLFMFVINALLLVMVGFFLQPGFQVEGFWSAFKGGIVISVVSWVVGVVTGTSKAKIKVATARNSKDRSRLNHNDKDDGGGPVIDVKAKRDSGSREQGGLPACPVRTRIPRSSRHPNSPALFDFRSATPWAGTMHCPTLARPLRGSSYNRIRPAQISPDSTLARTSGSRTSTQRPAISNPARRCPWWIISINASVSSYSSRGDFWRRAV